MGSWKPPTRPLLLHKQKPRLRLLRLLRHLLQPLLLLRLVLAAPPASLGQAAVRRQSLVQVHPAQALPRVLGHLGRGQHLALVALRLVRVRLALDLHPAPAPLVLDLRHGQAALRPALAHLVLDQRLALGQHRDQVHPVPGLRLVLEAVHPALVRLALGLRLALAAAHHGLGHHGLVHLALALLALEAVHHVLVHLALALLAQAALVLEARVLAALVVLQVRRFPTFMSCLPHHRLPRRRGVAHIIVL